ncbi:MAG TPA: acetate/propionate family kinase [Thiobacillus sp.]|nr:MAG: acetate kinase [Hydrogenophilales bacterium 28-61-11]OYZ58302.1 MAG: acetate kinase [Hydrogenophilales bacterium 16-61-112]OZA44882.1 MAG: acetate kinase [Hydrogenophilales bacterium 17-61-76]HQT35128.1 acetate/propionate family kinase [Thiobacillus sp.]HQT70343.1 acetate/propionate family kinase [Thiobacillus sp.]
MDTALLTVNAGSSSLKFALYRADAAPARDAQVRGSIDAIGQRGRFRLHEAAAGSSEHEVSAASHEQALTLLLDWLAARHPGLILRAAGHRVVHGGAEFRQPVRIDDQVVAALDKLIPLSPLHQPHNLAGIRALARLRPELPQVACFDTAFHHTLPPLARNFALPRDMSARGIRRYGFHGLSYEYIAHVLPEHLGDAAEGRVVVAHLGHGASLCAMRQRRSVETSMGFTPLDGIPMGSRAGALDPGVLLYLLREEGMSVAQLDELLHQRCGLLGVSGISGDVQTLLASAHPHAAEALDLFAYRTSQAIAAHAVALGGLDALVFTAGIGGHAAPVRAAICQHLAWLGLHLDAAANASHGPRISQADSPIAAWVIPTDEEYVIARHAWALTATPAL